MVPVSLAPLPPSWPKGVSILAKFFFFSSWSVAGTWIQLFMTMGRSLLSLVKAKKKKCSLNKIITLSEDPKVDSEIG